MAYQSRRAGVVKVQLTNVEALGAGTLAYDPVTETVAPHIHISVGLKAHSATAHTSHSRRERPVPDRNDHR